MAVGERKTTAVTTTAKNIDFNADGGAVLVDLNIASSWDGTVDFQGTLDGANYYNIPYVNRALLNPAWSVSQLTSLSTARYLLVGPLTQVRINCGAGTTGTLTAIYRVVPPGENYVSLVKEAVDNGLEVQGPVAHDGVVAGNPILMGGEGDALDSAKTAVGEGDVVRARFDTLGHLAVVITADRANTPVSADNYNAEDRSATAIRLQVNAALQAFDGTAIDRIKGDSTGGLNVQGPAASGAAVVGNPLLQGVRADTTIPTAVDDGDVVVPYADEYGRQVVTLGEGGGTTEVVADVRAQPNSNATITPVNGLAVMARLLAGQASAANTQSFPLTGGDNDASTDQRFALKVALAGIAPDVTGGGDGLDQLRTAGNSAPSLGALNVAPIGGDITLRASAASGGTGTSTAVDNLGWVKSFLASLDVTVIPTGGTPTLDVWIQTQTANGAWTDILHFTQVTTATSETLGAWTGPAGGASGTQGEAAAVTVDNFFALEAKSIGASTVRLIPLGNSLRVAWTEALGGGTGGYTFAVLIAAHA